MARVRLAGLTKRFSDVAAVDDLDLTIEHGEFLTLLGPSGCGKTTTLRCLAGLEEPSDGEIWIGEDLVASPSQRLAIPPNKRGAGMVFQSYALWPHMTVRANVAYPLRVARMPKADMHARVDELLEALGLAGLGDRLANELSGGQQQRVALARAMANHPRLLLFDEPLSNLDAKMRTDVRSEIRHLHDRTGTTSLYVTHDQEEAMVLSDRIVVMNHGKVQQVGTPREVYATPANAFVADFVGFENICSATVTGTDDPYLRVSINGLAVLRARATGPTRPRGRVTVAFRSAHVRLTEHGHTDAFECRVAETRYVGNRTELVLDRDGFGFVGYVDEAVGKHAGGAPTAGDLVTVSVSPDHVVVFDDVPTQEQVVGVGDGNSALGSTELLSR